MTSKYVKKGKILYIISVILILSGFTSLKVSEAKEELQKVYHVYVDDQFIGFVHNIEEVNSVIKQKIENAKNNYPNLEMTTSKKVEYIHETTFQPVNHDNQTIEWIRNNIEIAAVGQKISFGDQAVFVASKEDAESVLNELKLKFTSEETVNAYLSPDPIISESKVNPENILSVTQAVDSILNGTLQTGTHVVKQGEVLGEILNNYDISREEFFNLNSINESSVLQVGQELVVKSYKPMADVIEEKTTTENEEIPFNVEIIEDQTIYKGDQMVKQTGVNGQKKVQYKVIRKNGEIDKKEKLNEEIIQEPTNQIVIQGTKVIPSRGSGTFTWPTVGGSVTSKTGQRWGKLHKGTDIAGPSDPLILAADNGTVTFAGWDDGGYGNKIEISHNNGYKTLYAHLNSINVNVGQTVEKGSQIGIMGTTGNSTGVHLHIELYKNGQLVDFLDYINR